MLRCRLFSLAGALLCMLCTIPSLSATVTSVCDEYTDKITVAVMQQQYVTAIHAAAEYETAMRALYPAPTYEQGVFRSAADHLEFTCPFRDYTTVGINEAEWEDALTTASLGWRTLLTISHPETGDSLVLQTRDLSVTYRRFGERGELPRLSNAEFQKESLAAIEGLGVVTKQQLRTIGVNRAFFAEVAENLASPPFQVMILERDRCFFLFSLSTVDGDAQRNSERLTQLVQGVNLAYMPPDTAKIATVRARVETPENIAETLACIRSLAQLGEYGAAAEEICWLRSLLAAKMPPPVVEGNIARAPAYGITLRNPDPQQWRLTAYRDEANDLLSIESRYSIDPVGLLIGMFDMDVIFGPEATQAIVESLNDEEQMKQMLKNGGRGMMTEIGTTPIEAERFRLFKGTLAYEGTLTSTLPGHPKVRGIVIFKPEYHALIFLFMYGPTKTFEKQVEKFEAITNVHLTIP